MATERERMAAAGRRKLNQVSQKRDAAGALRDRLRGETTQSAASAINQALEAQRRAAESKAVKAHQETAPPPPSAARLLREAIVQEGRSE
jgi:hypothetical protein